MKTNGALLQIILVVLALAIPVPGCRSGSPKELDSNQRERLATLLSTVPMRGEIPDPAIELTIELGSAGANQLIRFISDSGQPDEVRIGALRLLVEVHPGLAFRPAVSALEQGPESLQVVAALALGKLRDSRSVATLCATLSIESEAVAAASAAALGQIGDISAVPHLVTALKREDPVGSAAVGALEQIKSPAANDELVALLGDPSDAVRARAATVLASTPDERAAPTLIELSKSPNESLRLATAKALGSISDDKAVEALSRLLRDRSVLVKRVAIFALGRSPSSRSSAILVSGLRRDPDFRIDYLHALSGRKDDTSVDALISALSDAERSVRDVASNGLGLSGSSKAVAPLIAGLERADRRLGEDAVIALGKIGDSRAVPALVKLLDSEDYRIAVSAVTALSLMDDRAAAAALRAAANHNRREVREAALSAASAVK